MSGSPIRRSAVISLPSSSERVACRNPLRSLIRREIFLSSNVFLSRIVGSVRSEFDRGKDVRAGQSSRTLPQLDWRYRLCPQTEQNWTTHDEKGNSPEKGEDVISCHDRRVWDEDDEGDEDEEVSLIPLRGRDRKRQAMHENRDNQSRDIPLFLPLDLIFLDVLPLLPLFFLRRVRAFSIEKLISLSFSFQRRKSQLTRYVHVVSLNQLRFSLLLVTHNISRFFSHSRLLGVREEEELSLFTLHQQVVRQGEGGNLTTSVVQLL